MFLILGLLPETWEFEGSAQYLSSLHSSGPQVLCLESAGDHLPVYSLHTVYIGLQLPVLPLPLGPLWTLASTSALVVLFYYLVLFLPDVTDH